MDMFGIFFEDGVDGPPVSHPSKRGLVSRPLFGPVSQGFRRSRLSKHGFEGPPRTQEYGAPWFLPLY